MLKHLQPLPISEEMLGAYLEGNLTVDEAGCVESVLQTDELLRGIVDEVNRDGIEWNGLADNTSIYEDLELMSDLQIPEIPSLTIFTNETISAHTPFYPDIVACAALEDVDIEEIEVPEGMNICIELDGVKNFGDDMDDPTIIMDEDL